MKIGFYAGSFDPFTEGHMHIVRQAAAVFDQVVIGFMGNPEKGRMFPANLIAKALETALAREKLKNVKVYQAEGELSVDAACTCGANYLIRGIRNVGDYNYEEDLAEINFRLAGFETIYFRAGGLSFIRSTWVRELMRAGKSIKEFVPKEIEAAILKGTNK